jgi:hypothetical protein
MEQGALLTSKNFHCARAACGGSALEEYEDAPLNVMPFSFQERDALGGDLRERDFASRINAFRNCSTYDLSGQVSGPRFAFSRGAAKMLAWLRRIQASSRLRRC